MWSRHGVNRFTLKGHRQNRGITNFFSKMRLMQVSTERFLNEIRQCVFKHWRFLCFFCFSFWIGSLIHFLHLSHHWLLHIPLSYMMYIVFVYMYVVYVVYVSLKKLFLFTKRFSLIRKWTLKQEVEHPVTIEHRRVFHFRPWQLRMIQDLLTYQLPSFLVFFISYYFEAICFWTQCLPCPNLCARLLPRAANRNTRRRCRPVAAPLFNRAPTNSVAGCKRHSGRRSLQCSVQPASS